MDPDRLGHAKRYNVSVSRKRFARLLGSKGEREVPRPVYNERGVVQHVAIYRLNRLRDTSVAFRVAFVLVFYNFFSAVSFHRFSGLQLWFPRSKVPTCLRLQILRVHNCLRHTFLANSITVRHFVHARCCCWEFREQGERPINS
jgi:hypothetical protein